MTTRLKQRLDRIGIDPTSSSSKLTESFCLIGTPLPPLEDKRDTNEFKPAWQQDVRDEKGRRRLHGAFTGGFSAGYFNTVGSAEGWTPSTFVSSRNSRAQATQARPEDFMDEEDLNELRESQKLVDTTERTALSSATTMEDGSLSAALQNLIPPIEDSPGAKLLRKMGWRPGQGIGPRVSHAKLRQQDAMFSTGSGGGLPTKPEPMDEEAVKHTFAPRDTKVPVYKTKDDNFGLGYSRGPGLAAATGRTPSGPNISAGFGLGALNDADEDDLDVYDGANDGSSRRRMAFDEDDDEEVVTIGSAGRKAPAGPVVKGKSGGTFHDGRQVPNGFVVAAKPEVEDKWFDFPEIPKGWQPKPTKLWESSKVSEIKMQQENVPPGDAMPSGNAGRRPQITADKRGEILGEVRLPSAPRSVFDYLSAKDRERLQSFAAKAKEGTAHAAKPPAAEPVVEQKPVFGAAEDASSYIPDLHPSIAKAAISGFQPFTTNPEKQKRYDVFLAYHSSPSPNAPYLARQPDQSQEEFHKELQDYAKAATIFKPASGAMADRFRSAAVVDNKPQANEGLHIPTNGGYLAAGTETTDKPEEKVEEDPKKYAAKTGMYGKLTREVTEWHPVRLLCKRFGVQDPYLNKPPEDQAMETDSRPSNVPPTAPPVVPQFTSSSAPENKGAPSTTGRRDIANIGLGEDESQGKDTLTYERPSMDIFKAIFASDNEDDDEDDHEMEVNTEEPVGSSTVAPGASAPKQEESKMEVDVPDGPVDPGSFRPTFVSKAEREGRKPEKEGKADKAKKKKSKPIVSFAADDEEEDSAALSIKPKTEKKRRREKDKEKESKKLKEAPPHEDEEMEWVEKDTPLPQPAAEALASAKPGRRTAADFM